MPIFSCARACQQPRCGAGSDGGVRARTRAQGPRGAEGTRRERGREEEGRGCLPEGGCRDVTGKGENLEDDECVQLGRDAGKRTWQD